MTGASHEDRSMTNYTSSTRKGSWALPISAGLAVSACLAVPWQTESTARESLWGSSSASISGLSAAGAPLVIVALAILVAAVAVVRGPRRTAAAAGVLGSVGGLALVAVAVAELGGAGKDRFAVTTETVAGTYVAIAVGALAAVVFLVAAVAAARRPALPAPAAVAGA